MIYRLSLWICDKFPYGWAGLVGFVLILIGFAISLVLTKKVTDYLLGAEWYIKPYLLQKELTNDYCTSTRCTFFILKIKIERILKWNYYYKKEVDKINGYTDEVN